MPEEFRRNDSVLVLEGYRAIEDPQNPYRVGGIPRPVVAPADGEGELDEVDFSSVQSILKHSEYAPSGWSKTPLAQLIQRRIRLGIDANIHDATYWLSEFECPQRVNGEKAYDPYIETTLVVAALYGEDPSKLPTSEAKIDSLFTGKVMASGYRAIMAGHISNAEQFERQVIEGKLGYATMLDGELSRLLHNCQRHGLVVDKNKQAEALQALNRMAGVRSQYNHDAQTWVQTHGATPREKLVRAWKVRQNALHNGAADNPSAILAWEKAHGLDETLEAMQEDGSLPPNIRTENLASHSEFVEELSRLYDGRTVVKSLGDFLQSYSPEALLPTADIELSDGSRGVVLDKGDPRIFTVGGDTRCCMTPTGIASSCIKAAYSDPNVSMLALYDSRGNLSAHSVLFTNPDNAPSTIVVDSIETNNGRNKDRIASLYREFFQAYLQSDALTGFDSVHLGMHNTESFEQPFASTDPIPPVINHSDAHRQVLLYERDPIFSPDE